MIEVTVDKIDGVRFLKDVHILEEDDKFNGVPVHYVFHRWHVDNEFLRAIKALGMKRAGYDYTRDADLYVRSDFLLWRFKVNSLLLKVYWRIVWWLYDNARFFKRIPEAEMFSWRYFTPYCWYQAIKAKRIWEAIKRWDRGE